MPYALVIALQRANDAPLPAAGEYVHAAFFRLLSDDNQAPATRLHGVDGRKPFTLSLFREPQGRGAPESDTSEGPAPPARGPRVGDVGALRVTFLDDSLFSDLAGALLMGGLQAGLLVGDARFVITGLQTTPGSHDLAGAISYADLWTQATPEESLTLRFATPTVFRSQKGDALWPEPRLVWQSWARTWTQNAGTAAPAVDEPRLVELATTRVAVTRYNLQTHRVPLKEGAQTGFVGSCTYALYGLPEADRRALTALADFAFYCGTGRKTTMGMGQTLRRRLEG